jgi:hypothetical protein
VRHERLTRNGKPNGGYEQLGFSRLSYEHHDSHLLEKLVHLKANGTSQATFAYGYDAADRLVYRDENGQANDTDWISLPSHRPPRQSEYNRMTVLRAYPETEPNPCKHP